MATRLQLHVRALTEKSPNNDLNGGVAGNGTSSGSDEGYRPTSTFALTSAITMGDNYTSLPFRSRVTMSMVSTNLATPQLLSRLSTTGSLHGRTRKTLRRPSMARKDTMNSTVSPPKTPGLTPPASVWVAPVSYAWGGDSVYSTRTSEPDLSGLDFGGVAWGSDESQAPLKK